MQQHDIDAASLSAAKRPPTNPTNPPRPHPPRSHPSSNIGVRLIRVVSRGGGGWRQRERSPPQRDARAGGEDLGGRICILDPDHAEHLQVGASQPQGAGHGVRQRDLEHLPGSPLLIALCL